MSDSIHISDALLRTPLVREPVRNPREYQRQLDGKGTMPATAKRTRFKQRKWQSSPDRELSWKRKRTFGGCGTMLPEIRNMYTEGERAALTVIAHDVKCSGKCDKPIDRIAAIAGVCRTTVQNALRAAKRNNHLLVYYRPRPGRKNLPNVVHIINGEWLAWIKRGPPPLLAALGFNLFHPTESKTMTNSTIHYPKSDRDTGLSLSNLGHRIAALDSDVHSP